MNLVDLKTLPEEVQDFIWGTVSDFNYYLSGKFSFTFEQAEFINNLEDEIILKKYKAIDLPKHLETMPDKFNIEVRDLALDLAYKVFWPLQDYLGEVDRLILRLGGKVPRHQVLKVKKSIDKNIFPKTTQGIVREMMDKYINFKELRLTANKIINKKGFHVSPIVDNWIKDYVHFSGANQRDSLKRARYLSKAPNVIQLNDSDRETLRHFFLSYDENQPVDFNYEDNILRVGEIPKEVSKTGLQDTNNVAVNKTITKFQQDILKFDKQLLSSDIILSEADNDVNKVNDVLWQAIGIQDSNKTVSCLRVLLEKRALDSMIKTDARFKNILKRFIGIKYGRSMESAIDDNLDKLIIRRLFLEMIFVSKFNLSKEELFLSIFYLSNIVPNSGQIMYLNKATSEFEWRELQVLGNKFFWVA